MAQGVSAFDRRLDPSLTGPIAVAFSGGGDSLAALLATKAWADRCGRPVLVLTVDHRLQPQSGEWTRAAEQTARRLGARFQALSWDAKKPAAGLPAAARAARHRLIAEAARAAGAQVVVFGHTADDVLEADLMRTEGSTLGRLREWGPSPAWPEGRGVFLLRPLLTERRAAIREALQARGEDWIDDPANDDLRLTRSRARTRLAGVAVPAPAATDDPETATLAAAVVAPPQGYLRLDRDALRRARPSAARRVLSAALLSVGGGQRPPRGERLERLLARVARNDGFCATLAGAKLVASDDLLIVRDAGEAKRGGLAPLALEPDAATVWDGRFETATSQAGLSVQALAGAMGDLPPAQREALKIIPAAARPGLPLMVGAPGGPTCPILAGQPSVTIASLVAARFLSACGVISKEPAV